MLWRQTDYFYIRHSSASGTLNPHHMRAVKHMRKRSQQLDMASHLIGDFYVWQKMGVDFGLLSGDLNIAHIFDTTASIFSGGKAFIQGLCTLNIVISMLWKKYGTALSSLNVNYARPVYRGQHIFLLCHANQLEVISAQGQLLAFGTFTLRDPEQPQPGGH